MKKPTTQQETMINNDDGIKKRKVDDRERIIARISNACTRSDMNNTSNSVEDETSSCTKRTKNLDVIDDDGDHDQHESLKTGNYDSNISLSSLEGRMSDVVGQHGDIPSNHIYSSSSSSNNNNIVMRLIQKETLRHLEFAWEAERNLARLCQQEEEEEEKEEHLVESSCQHEDNGNVEGGNKNMYVGVLDGNDNKYGNGNEAITTLHHQQEKKTSC